MTDGAARGREIPLGFGNLRAASGDHIAHFFQTSKEGLDLLAGFLGAGLEAGEKCVCLIAEDDRSALEEALADEGIDVEEHHASTQLLIGAGMSRPEELKQLLTSAMSDVPDKFPSLRWVGQMTWSLMKLPTSEALMEWETHCNVVGAPAPIFLCQYDLTVFPGTVVMDAFRTHPVCVVANAIHRNPYYEEPEGFLAELRARGSTPLAAP